MDPFFIPYTRINLKWIIHLNVRAETITLLEENIGVNHLDLGFGNGCLDMTPNAEATKGKIDKLDFTKIKNFYAAKQLSRK